MKVSVVLCHRKIESKQLAMDSYFCISVIIYEENIFVNVKPVLLRVQCMGFFQCC